MFMWTGQFRERPDRPIEDRVVVSSNKFTPSENEKFKFVPALNKDEDGVSFQYMKNKFLYLTCRSRLCFVELKKTSTSYGNKFIY